MAEVAPAGVSLFQEVAEKLPQLQPQTQQAGYLPNAGKLTLSEYLTTQLEGASQWLRQVRALLHKTLANALKWGLPTSNPAVA